MTVGFHPTLEITLVATAMLSLCYAAAVYLNQMVLVPRLFYEDKQRLYYLSLTASMLLLTFMVLSLIRAVYRWEGYGEYLGSYWENFVIDLFGMVVYVSVTSLLTRCVARFRIEWD